MRQIAFFIIAINLACLGSAFSQEKLIGNVKLIGTGKHTDGPTVGYFVMSNTPWNGSFGGGSGLADAAAKCLTGLTSNTGGVAYACANPNAHRGSGKLHAFTFTDT